MASPWIDYLKTVDSPTLANAIELLEVRGRHEGFLPVDFKCMFPEFGRTVGYAVTAQVETMTRQEPGGADTFVELFRLVDSAPKPAVIVLQEMGPHGNYAAHSGEVMATIFTRLGAVALVSDCAVRDLPEVRAMGFQYFARGAVVSHGWFRIIRTGVPVQVGGLSIKMGDLLHGDENGLVKVPAGVEETLPAKVDDVRTREKRLMDWVKSNEFRIDQLQQKMVE
jgi:4-hydroxy-4-methyl-2-oxoglutarate aldolase